MMKYLMLIAVAVMSVGTAWADEDAYLDAYYGEPDTPNVSQPFAFDLESSNSFSENLLKVDHLDTALAQTEVKSQGRRGTCSIFSSNSSLLGLQLLT